VEEHRVQNIYRRGLRSYVGRNDPLNRSNGLDWPISVFQVGVRDDIFLMNKVRITQDGLGGNHIVPRATNLSNMALSIVSIMRRALKVVRQILDGKVITSISKLSISGLNIENQNHYCASVAMINQRMTVPISLASIFGILVTTNGYVVGAT
jgi:hypothetical protein